jgi:Flp pilus assembly protein TadD
MTDRPRWTLWLTAAAILAAPAAIVAVLLLHDDPGDRQPARSPRQPPYPSTIVRHGSTYQAQSTVVSDASVDPDDPHLVYAFVTDVSNASDQRSGLRRRPAHLASS